MKQRTASAASTVVGLVLVLTLGTLTGCSLKQAAPVKSTYLIETARPVSAQGTRGTGTLRVRPLQVSEPFDGRGFVYRTGESSFESDFYHEFLIPPRALLTAQLRRWIDASGKFYAVIDSASKADASQSLEGSVTALYGDYRESSAPKAVLEMQFLLLNDRGSSPQIVFQKGYQQAVLLDGRGSEALTRGWSRALAQIFTSLEADLPAIKP
jgi:cholesterol transport system auxiliary component